MSSRTWTCVGPAASRVLNAKLLWRIDDRMAVRTTRRSSSPATRVFQLMHPSTGRIHQEGVTDLQMNAVVQTPRRIVMPHSGAALLTRAPPAYCTMRAGRLDAFVHPSTGRIHQKGVTDLHMNAAAQALSRHSLRVRGGGDEDDAAYEGGGATQL